MSLADQQQAFMAAILDEEAPLPGGWSARHGAGLAIYRNNYRSALVEALAATYERTLKWVGEESFRRAAAHHLILHPPGGWTIDDAGAGFERTLAELFAGDPEVAELAALEWAMHRAFVAADAAPLAAADFAAQTADFGEEDWGALGFAFVPGTAVLAVGHDIGGLWSALGAEPFAAPDLALAEAHRLIVWREGLRPVFRLADMAEGEALAAAQGGSNFGDLCAGLVERLGPDEGVARAGSLLGRWLQDGLIAGLAVPPR